MAEVASAFVSLVPSAKGFGSKIGKELGGDLDKAGRDGGKRMGSGIKTGFAPMIKGIAAPLAAAFGVAAVGSFFKSAISGASDLVETTTKIEAIFGDASGAVQKFATGGAKALGQSKQSVLDAAATFGTFGKAAGLGGQDLAKFSTGFASLSTDLASFNNTTPQEAVEAIGAALRGEAEPLRRYGVLLDDASMRQKALELGLVKTTKEALTPQNKVLAAQALIYEQTKDAQGDFQKTSGGLANQQRILSATFTDLKARIGAELLPVVTGFVTFLNNNLLPAVGAVSSFLTSTFGPAFSTARDIVKGLFDLFVNGDFTGTLAGALGVEEDSKIVDYLFRIREALIEAMGVAREAYATVSDFIRANFQPAVRAVADFVTGTLLPGFRSLAGFLATGVFPVIQQVAQFLAGTFTPTFKALQQFVVGSVLPALQGLAARVKDNLPQLAAIAKAVGIVVVGLAALVAKVLGFVLPVLLKLAGFLFGALFDAIGLVIGIIGGLVRAFQAVSPAVSAVVSLVGSLLGGFVNVVRGVLNTVVGIFTGDFGKIKTGVGQAIGGIVTLMTALPKRILGALGDLGSLLYDAGKELIAGLIRGITAKIGALKDKMGDVASAVKGFLPGSPVKEGPLRSWNRGAAGARLMDLLASGITGAPVERALNDALDLTGLRVGGPQFIAQRLGMPSVAAPSIGSGGLAGGGLVEEVQGLREDIRRMPRDYRLGERQGVA